MNTLVESQSPVILGNIALDVIERMQELQEQSQGYFTGYQTTGDREYIQGALQYAQINTLLADLSRDYLDAVQGSAQEQQIDQILQQHNSSVDSLRQQSGQLSEQAQGTKNAFVEAAQQAGLTPAQIELLLQNARTAGAAAGAAVLPTLPGAVPSAPTPPAAGGGSSRDDDRDDSGTPDVIPVTAIGAITGIAEVGGTLTAGAVAPAGATVTYQWLRADTSDGPYTAIAGATAQHYTPGAADARKYLQVKATGYGRYTGTVSSGAVLVAEEEPEDGELAPGVVLMKAGQPDEDPFAYQEGDALEFRFDRPVRAEALSDIAVWQAALAEAEAVATFGTGAVLSYEDEDEDGFAEIFVIRLGENSKLSIIGVEITLPGSVVIDEEENDAGDGVRFTLPALRINSNYTELGASLVNLDSLDSLQSLEEDEGAYGVFGEAGLPGEVLLRGVLSDALPDEASGEWNLTHLPRLEAGLWYYGEDYEKRYISPGGEDRSEWTGIDAEIVALRSALGSGDDGSVYTWEVELPPGLRGALWSSSNRDYFMDLKIMDGDGGEAKLIEAVGAMTGDMERPYVRNMEPGSEAGTLRVMFNEYLEGLEQLEELEPEELNGVLLLTLGDTHGQQALAIDSVEIDDEGWESSLTLRLDSDSTSILQNLPGDASLHLAVNYGLGRDRAGNVLPSVESYLYRHAQAGESGNWVKVPYPMISSQVGNDEQVVIQTDEKIYTYPGALNQVEEGAELKDYFILTSTTGAAITAGVASAIYETRDDVKGTITLTLGPGFATEELTYLELKRGLFCGHGISFATGVGSTVNGEGRVVLGYFSEEGYVPSDYSSNNDFKLRLDFEEYPNSRNTNEELAFILRHWNLTGINPGEDLKNHFVMKNVIDTGNGRYYRPTTARFAEAIYRESVPGSNTYEVIFKIQPGNLRAYEEENLSGVRKYGVIKMLPSLQEHWRFTTPDGAAEEELVPWYLPDGTWGGR